MLEQAASGIEKFIDWSGRTVSWLALLMVITTFLVVVLRNAFDIGWIALPASITYMHAAEFLVGAAYTLQQEAHVRVDIFYTKFTPTTRAWIDLCGALFMLLPFMLFLSWTSWDYIRDSWQVMEGSREAGGLPAVFLLKSFILVMTTLLSLQACAQILRAIQKILGLK